MRRLAPKEPRRMRWAGHIPGTGDMKNEYTILIGKREEKKSLGRRGYIWNGEV
jgi:hypothetical protein